MRNGRTTEEVQGGGRQPGPGGQEKGDEKAGVENEVALRGRERLGEEGRGAREQGKWTAAPDYGDSRGVGTGWEVPGPFSRYLLEVPVDRMQVVLEVRNEGLLPALQRLLVPHAILQAVEHPAHAGAQRLDGTDGLGKGFQVHADT